MTCDSLYQILKTMVVSDFTVVDISITVNTIR